MTALAVLALLALTIAAAFTAARIQEWSEEDD